MPNLPALHAFLQKTMKALQVAQEQGNAPEIQRLGSFLERGNAVAEKALQSQPRAEVAPGRFMPLGSPQIASQEVPGASQQPSNPFGGVEFPGQDAPVSPAEDPPLNWDLQAQPVSPNDYAAALGSKRPQEDPPMRGNDIESIARAIMGTAPGKPEVAPGIASIGEGVINVRGKKWNPLLTPSAEAGDPESAIQGLAATLPQETRTPTGVEALLGQTPSRPLSTSDGFAGGVKTSSDEDGNRFQKELEDTLGQRPEFLTLDNIGMMLLMGAPAAQRKHQGDVDFYNKRRYDLTEGRRREGRADRQFETTQEGRSAERALRGEQSALKAQTEEDRIASREYIAGEGAKEAELRAVLRGRTAPTLSDDASKKTEEDIRMLRAALERNKAKVK